MSSVIEAMSKIEQILHQQYDLVHPDEVDAEAALLSIINIANEALIYRPVNISISDAQVQVPEGCEAYGCVCHTAQPKRLRVETE